MKEKALVFTKEEFQTYVMNQMKEVFPNITFEVVELFQLQAQREDGIHLFINLNQPWNLYEQSGDMNQVFDYLETMVTIQQHVGENEGFNFNRDKDIILPAIRNVVLTANEKENTVLSKNLLGDLVLTYVLDYPKFTSALSQDQLLNLLKQNTPDKTDEELLASKGYQFLEELIQEQAILNLKKKGWVKPTAKRKTPFGMIYKFVFDERDYHYQFFIKEWAERYIGPRFLITFPSKYTALVVALKGTGDLKDMATQWITAETMQTLMREKAYRISSNVYGYTSQQGWIVERIS